MARIVCHAPALHPARPRLPRTVLWLASIASLHGPDKRTRDLNVIRLSPTSGVREAEEDDPTMPKTTLTRRSFLAMGAAATLARAGQASASGDLASAFRPGGNGRVDHGAFAAILAAIVRPDGAGYNRVDYRAARERREMLADYVRSLEAVDPRGLSRDEAHAYWINLYNARTLDVVVAHLPVKSIRDIDLGGGLFKRGPWSAKLMRVGGLDLTLDDVEHSIVRAIFRDPMSHYGLNCASYSCPNLAAKPYTGANVDQLLREGAGLYVNHPRGVRVDDRRITASRIYDWYADDFGGADGTRAHWLVHASPDRAAAIRSAKATRYEYDWSLNAA